MSFKGGQMIKKLTQTITLLACLGFGISANATLLFTNVNYTTDSVTFTVDGDMTGYAPHHLQRRGL